MINLDDIPLKNSPFQWFVVGGWALDLFLGKETRTHQDVDLGVFRRDQLVLQNFLFGWALRKIDQGEQVTWRSGELLSLPVHEIHAESPSGLKIEVLFSESDGTRWIYRRDPRVTAPLSKALIEILPGLWVLSPEIVLLFKSKNVRDKDQQDFDRVMPRLSSSQAQWLRTALGAVYESHEWITKLSV